MRPASAFLVAAALPALGGAVSCGQFANCTECNAETYACHWCPDKKCHAIGSVYGCLVTPSCTGVGECERASPEFIGYGHASGAAIFAGLFAIVFALVCCCSCGNALRIWRESTSFTVQRADIRYQELQARGEPASSGPARDDGWRHVPKETRLVTPRRAAVLSRVGQALCAAATLLVIVFTAIYMVVSPQMPRYTICTHELELRSIFSGLLHAKTAATYNVLFSVYNPNRLAIRVEEAEATFSYKGSAVGRWRLDRPRTFPAGAVTDLVAKLEFNPSLGQARSMYGDVRSDQLYLGADATGTADVLLGDSPAYTVSSSFHMSPILVGGPADLSLCKCGADYAST